VVPSLACGAVMSLACHESACAYDLILIVISLGGKLPPFLPAHPSRWNPGWVGLGSCRLHNIVGKTDSVCLAGIGEFRCDKILQDVSRKAFQATSYGITTSGCMCRFLRHLLIVSVIIGMFTVIDKHSSNQMVFHNQGVWNTTLTTISIPITFVGGR